MNTKTVELAAPLTRDRKDHARGEVLPLPAGLADKLVNRGRAVLVTTGGVSAATVALLAAPDVAVGADVPEAPADAAPE